MRPRPDMQRRATHKARLAKGRKKHAFNIWRGSHTREFYRRMRAR
jgi:hypothetical protein